MCWNGRRVVIKLDGSRRGELTRPKGVLENDDGYVGSNVKGGGGKQTRSKSTDTFVD